MTPPPTGGKELESPADVVSAALAHYTLFSMAPLL